MRHSLICPFLSLCIAACVNMCACVNVCVACATKQKAHILPPTSTSLILTSIVLREMGNRDARMEGRKGGKRVSEEKG